MALDLTAKAGPQHIERHVLGATTWLRVDLPTWCRSVTIRPQTTALRVSYAQADGAAFDATNDEYTTIAIAGRDAYNARNGFGRPVKTASGGTAGVASIAVAGTNPNSVEFILSSVPI